MISSCAICGKEIEVQICCSGHECGCMGMPVEPPVCSEKCYDEYMKPKEEKAKEQNFLTGQIITSQISDDEMPSVVLMYKNKETKRE